MKTMNILGIKVNFEVGLKNACNLIEDMIKKADKQYIVCTTNPEFIIEAQKDKEFKEIINSSDLSLPDGMGVVMAGEYLDKIGTHKHISIFDYLSNIFTGLKVAYLGLSGRYTSKRVTGVSLADCLLKLSEDKNYSVFLLGGWPRDKWGRNVKLEKDYSHFIIESINKKYPKANIVGAASNFSSNITDDNDTISYIKNKMEEINIDHIDILMVAYGQRNQEKWILRNSKKIPATVSIGLGGTFDYITGYSKSPSSFFTSRGLEWLYRLFKEPFRLKRILNAFPIFPLMLFFHTIKNKNK